MDNIDKLRMLLARKGSKMIVGGFRPSGNPLASWFGRVNVAASHEVWPAYKGMPMMPLCQINCAELPYIPDSLAGVAFIAVFIAPDRLPVDVAPNGEGWALRTYESLAHLVPVQQPVMVIQDPIKPFPVRWELIENDYPCWGNVPEEYIDEYLVEHYHDFFKTQYCSKIGGWPSLIQGGIFYQAKTEYVFQIDTENKAQWAWGDQGTGYFGRETESGTWVLDWQQF
jgi:Domain of unknown function (DUF1963)